MFSNTYCKDVVTQDTSGAWNWCKTVKYDNNSVLISNHPQSVYFQSNAKHQLYDGVEVALEVADG